MYSPAVKRLVVIAGELGQLLDDDGAGRHVDADGERLGGEDHLRQPLDEACLDGFLERRDHPGVMGGDAGLELGEELLVAEHLQVVVVETLEAGLDDGADACLFVARGQPHSGGEARAGGLVALVAAEDEDDRRQQLALGEEVDDLEPARGVEDASAAAPRRPLVACRRGAPQTRRGGRPPGWARPPTNVGRKCRRSLVRSPTR